MKTKDQIQDEALAAIGDLRKSGLEISMGVGKTLIGLRHMAANYTSYAKYLVLAPKKKIFQSWSDESEKFKLTHLDKHITFSTYRSLHKQDLDFDIVYLDECHSLKTNHSPWLRKFIEKGGRVIGLTGTYPDKDYTEKGKMCNEYCPKVYSYLTDDAVDDNILNDYKIIVHPVKLDIKSTLKKEGKFGAYTTSEVKEYAYWSKRVDDSSTAKQKQLSSIQRMKSLQKYPSKEMYAKALLKAQSHKTIVFANTQAQADDLCMHSVHSKNKKSEENLILFKEGLIHKLSAVEQLSEGVNIPDLRVGIIMHSYSNNRKASQKIGRLLRLNPSETATVHILCYIDTIDKEWVTNALSSFDQSKITWK